MTGETLGVLLLEDSSHDAELVERELRRASIDASVHRVQSEAAFRAALHASPPQIILADFHLPDFDGLSALRIARSLVPHVPFILVSGGLGEELAVEVLREGATDYVMKNRLSDLVPAVTRALAEAEQNRSAPLLRPPGPQEQEPLHRRSDWILAGAPVPIAGIDEEGRITVANPAMASMTAWPLEALTGTALHDVLHPGACVPDCPLRQPSISRTTLRGEQNCVRRDGTPFRARYTLSPVVIDGTTIAGVCVLEDLSEKMRMEHEAERMNRGRMLTRVAATIAHEFNNVLMGIQPFGEVIQRISTDEKVKRFADRILESVARGRKMTRQMAGVTQSPVPVMEPMSLTDWLPSAVAEIREVAGARVELQLDLPAGPLRIRGDRTQLRQALSNLVVNAAEAMPEGGRVTISAATDGDTVRLQISDTGTGMTADILPNIFAPLFTTRRSHMGLGLTVAEQIVGAHGGAIQVQSQAGSGTIFTIDLPLDPAADEIVEGDGTP